VAAKRGVRNLLIHAGLLVGKAEQTPSQMLDMPGGECFTFSEQDGLIEPWVDLGQPVRKGDVVAQVWPADRTGVGPAQYRAANDSEVGGRHIPGVGKTGDCIAVVAQPVATA
jgi:N-alpha-acetyl-L-2,4-diaminobutyrate deacetylase